MGEKNIKVLRVFDILRLDISYENIVDAHWTVEVIDTLREAYAEAQTIRQKYREFIEWLDRDTTNCIKVVKLWNRCKEPHPETHHHYLAA